MANFDLELGGHIVDVRYSCSAAININSELFQ